jgi:hypothetical protein
MKYAIAAQPLFTVYVSLETELYRAVERLLQRQCYVVVM